jgi:hypothetical protein
VEELLSPPGVWNAEIGVFDIDACLLAIYFESKYQLDHKYLD